MPCILLFIFMTPWLVELLYDDFDFMDVYEFYALKTWNCSILGSDVFRNMFTYFLLFSVFYSEIIFVLISIIFGFKTEVRYFVRFLVCKFYLLIFIFGEFSSKCKLLFLLCFSNGLYTIVFFIFTGSLLYLIPASSSSRISPSSESFIFKPINGEGDAGSSAIT